mmetsp:Transcript_27241/g.43833  ORF Transcript_27241/g.43833 Transcript_27241/m.43833 type:complete len:101 (-) Transcript_27241:1441-1743(-)
MRLGTCSQGNGRTSMQFMGPFYGGHLSFSQELFYGHLSYLFTTSPVMRVLLTAEKRQEEATNDKENETHTHTHTPLTLTQYTITTTTTTTITKILVIKKL